MPTDHGDVLIGTGVPKPPEVWLVIVEIFLNYAGCGARVLSIIIDNLLPFKEILSSQSKTGAGGLGDVDEKKRTHIYLKIS